MSTPGAGFGSPFSFFGVHRGSLGTGGDLGGGMAHLSRLIWFALGVMLAAVPMLAFADDYPPIKEYRWGNEKYYDVQTACASAIAAYSGNFGPLTMTSCSVNPNGQGWQAKFTQTNGSAGSYSGVIVDVCLGGGALQLVGGVFTCRNAPPCEEGEVRDETGVCIPPPCEPPNFIDQFGECREPCPEAGSSAGSGHVYQGGNVCLQSCERKATKCSLKMNIEGPQDDRAYVCDYVFTGGSCEWIGEQITDAPPGPEPNPEPEPEPCGSGKVSGTFNGQTICLDAGENTLRDDTKKETTETTKDDGTKEVRETTTDTRSQFDPKTGKTKTTITETTTTTTVDANGNTTGTNTEIVIRQRESSGNNVDKDSGNGDGGEEEGGGTFAGACGSEPLCEGDAIQCAIAAATFKTECALAASDEVLLEFETIRQFTGTGEGEGLDRKEIDVTTSLQVSEIGGGAGLTDQSFTIMGKTIVIPFSEINRFIEMFGYAIMMIAWIGAWRIIVGAF